MSHDFKIWDDTTLRAKSFSRLEFGVLPFEKWARYFASEQYQQDQPLREKSFAMWFYTLSDYLLSEGKFLDMINEMKQRDIEISSLVEISSKLSKYYKSILQLFTKEEQLFLGYIREHIAHGSIGLWSNSAPRRRWYCPETDKIEDKNIPIEELRQMLNQQFKLMPGTILSLLQRMLVSSQFSDLSNFIIENLNNTKLNKLRLETGVKSSSDEV